MRRCTAACVTQCMTSRRGGRGIARKIVHEWLACNIAKGRGQHSDIHAAGAEEAVPECRRRRRPHVVLRPAAHPPLSSKASCSASRLCTAVRQVYVACCMCRTVPRCPLWSRMAHGSGTAPLVITHGRIPLFHYAPESEPTAAHTRSSAALGIPSGRGRARAFNSACSQGILRTSAA